MTRVEAIRAALRVAVRDGDRELAKALTKIAVEEIRVPRPGKNVHFLWTLPSGDRGKS